jgi:hypothetical protein
MVSSKPTKASPAVARPSGLRRAADRYALRPLARVQRIALFEREVRERLSRSALDVLFACAEVMSEGQRQPRAGKEAFFGSTMFTIDLGALSPTVRDACDAATAQRLAALVATDVGVAARVKALAAAEAARLAGARPRSVSTEIKVRARGAKVFIDVDVEATL